MPLDDLSETLKDLAIKVPRANPCESRTESPGVGERAQSNSGRGEADGPKADPMRLPPQTGPWA